MSDSRTSVADDREGDGLEIPAEDAPVPAGPATLPMHVLAMREENRLVLGSSYGVLRHALYGFVFVGLLISIIGVIVAICTGEWLQSLLTSGIIILLGSIGTAWHWYRQILLPRVTFDKAADVVTFGWRDQRGWRPLASVIGVHVMKTIKNFGGPELNLPAMTVYQMNLILDDANERRLNVATTGDLGNARSAAKEVAEFLGVPVLDRVGMADEATWSGVASKPEEAATLVHATVPSATLVERTDVLVIRPHRGTFTQNMYIQWPPLALAIWFIAQGNVGWPAFLMAGAFLSTIPIFLAARLITSRWQARFDRESGIVTLRWATGRLSKPIASVKAVEFVENYEVAVVGRQHLVNLVPNDALEPRIRLVADANRKRVRQIAERLAAFLNVLLVGEQRATIDRTGEDEAVNPIELLERSPLAPGKASIRGPALVTMKGEDVLLIRRRRQRAWLRIIPGVAGLGAEFFLVWLFVWGPLAGQGDAGVTVLLVLVSAVISQVAAAKPLFLDRDRFDRTAGTLTLGAWGAKGKYPLERVLAVQLIPGGLVDHKPGRSGGERVAYQINLVLADADEDRLNLTADADLEWTRASGRQIADFLGVPLIDQIA